MANNYFRFKSFVIHQELCAMKVTTDACLFGAIVAGETMQRDFGTRILDIGTGTGLLSLMFAQKNPLAKIEAVEIDTHAFEQARANVADSSFAKQVTVHHADIKTLNAECLYDFIFTNPPFFENDLKSIHEKRNKALHDASLTLTELMIHIDRLLHADAMFSILLPFHRTSYFIELAATCGWHCMKQFNIKQTEKHDFFRSVLFFTRRSIENETQELTIKITGEYSDTFKSFLKDYYLYL